MLLKRNKFKPNSEQERSQQERSEQECSEQERSEQERSKQERSEQERSEQERSQQNENERHVNLKEIKQHQKPNNISDIINLYYDTISENERELSHLKRERKNMKVMYINKYLNRGSKLTSDENIKRQELKKQLLSNGESIVNIKTKLIRLKDDLITNLGLVVFDSL